jgi:hypothetical protein
MSAILLALLVTASMFAVVFGVFYIVNNMPK